MNKIASLLSLTALCVGFVACDEVEKTFTEPQTNPQEPIFDAANLTVTTVPSVVDLAPASDNPMATVDVATVTATDFPTASVLELEMQIAKTATFENAPAPIEAAVNAEGVVSVNAQDLEKDYYNSITKNPAQGTVYVRFIANAVNGTEKVRIGGPDKYYGVGELNILPVNEGLVIEDTYYLIYGTGTAGDVANAIPFNHSDVDVYDDSKFSVNFSISASEAAAGYTWWIAPESVVKVGQRGDNGYGPENDGDTQESGKLIKSATTYGVITGEGPHMIEMNMRDLTYKVSLAIEQLYTPGNSNGWSQTNSQILTTSDYINYYGFAHLNGEFKFSSQPDWGGINYGSTGVEGELTNDGGAGNLNAPEDGLYWCQVDLVKMTYKLTPITSLGAIGGFNSWGGQTIMEPSADFLIWSGAVDFDGGEWKFRANDDWGINLGGSMDNLVRDGANLQAPGEGTYTVTLDLSAIPYTATAVKK